MKSKKKKNNRRSKLEHPDLDPKFNLKRRYELFDQDYVHKLSPKEKEWLNKFNREYITDTLDRDKRHRNLHKTKKLIKDCDDRNNSRNRDILTIAKAAKMVDDYEELREMTNKNGYEDFLIEEIDKKDARTAVEWLADQLDRDEENLEANLTDEVEKE